MTKSVLIVGCGVFGLSTALELAEKGDYKITAIDAYPVPSPLSASCDYNKIVRQEYNEMCYTKMSVEALKLWRSKPYFKGVYNECGRILVTPESAKARNDFELASLKNLQKLGQGTKVELFKSSKKVAEKFKELEYNSIDDNILVKYNPECGLGHAANALKAVYFEAVNKGVQFYFGPKGKAIKMETIDGVDYVITEDGSKYTADQIVISSGAATGGLIDLKQQQTATGLFVTFIRLTQDEYEKYKNLPIVFDSVEGYFFPPDPETNILKIALPGSGASNYIKSNFSDNKVSLPRYKIDNPQDTMPKEYLKVAKNLLARYVPELSYHRLFGHKACWIADTSDSHFIIDKVPEFSHVYVASGDSGHAFKFLPNIGKYIVQKLENTLSLELANNWKWREDIKEFDAKECEWRVVSEDLDFAEIDWSTEEIAKL